MAAVDYFLKIDGIPGESQDAQHSGEMDLVSWSWGEMQAGTMAVGGGGGAGKVQMQDFSFVMYVNKATPKLFLACASGEHLPKVVLTARKAGREQQEFLQYRFYDCLISSYRTGGSEMGDIVPTEQISLNYSKIEMEYKEQKTDGSLGGAVKVGWDVKKNEKV